jgi:hypothetical protein
MDELRKDCLVYMRDHFRSVIKIPLDLACLSDVVISGLSDVTEDRQLVTFKVLFVAWVLRRTTEKGLGAVVTCRIRETKLPAVCIVYGFKNNCERLNGKSSTAGTVVLCTLNRCGVFV